MPATPRSSVDAIDDLRAHFDARAASYSASASWVTDPIALEPIVSWFARHEPENAVEFGVGTGAVPESLSRAGVLPARYSGLDISPAMLRYAAGWTPVLADASQTPFDRESASVVVARQIFHYFNAPLSVIDEARRIMQRAGSFIVSHIVPFDDERDVAWWTRAVTLRQPLRRQALTRADLCEWLTGAGFTVTDTVEVVRRSSLRSWLRRYPLSPMAEAALNAHFRWAPAAVARNRELECTHDGDIMFDIRWVTVFASLPASHDPAR